MVGISAITDRAIKSQLCWPASTISAQSLLQTLIIEKALFSQPPSFPLGNIYVRRPINAGNLLCGKTALLRVRELRAELSSWRKWPRSPMAVSQICWPFMHTGICRWRDKVKKDYQLHRRVGYCRRIPGLKTVWGHCWKKIGERSQFARNCFNMKRLFVSLSKTGFILSDDKSTTTVLRAHPSLIDATTLSSPM